MKRCVLISTFHRFRDRDRNDTEGGIFLKEAPEMLAAGQVPTFQLYKNGSFSMTINT